MNRPTGVTILAVLDFIGAGFGVLGALMGFVGGAFLATFLSRMAARSGGAAAGAGFGAALGIAFGIVFLFCAAMAAVIGYGLWSLKEWGRILQIVFAGIGALLQVLGVLGALVRFHMGALLWNLIWLGINAWIIFYLVQPQIKAAFAQRSPMQAATGD